MSNTHSTWCSPFTGQGANQALTDGPLLVSWLQRASMDSAGPCFWREMVRRTAIKVRASREAAAMLHSSQILKATQDFAGVKPDCIEELLLALNERKIGAEKGGALDQLVQDTIHDLGSSKQFQLGTTAVDLASEHECRCKQALVLAGQGNSVALRNLSRQYSEAIRLARDEKGRSCLHLAALGGHFHTCRWLLTDASVSPHALDNENRTPLQISIAQGHGDIRTLLSLQPNNDNVSRAS